MIIVIIVIIILCQDLLPPLRRRSHVKSSYTRTVVHTHPLTHLLLLFVLCVAALASCWGASMDASSTRPPTATPRSASACSPTR